MLTMLGPVGVSNFSDAISPPNAAKAPSPMAQIAIVSGVRAKGRAVAAGMISMAAMSRAPTTLIATATMIASANVRINCSRFGFPPEAWARSGFSVAASSADQRHANSSAPNDGKVKAGDGEDFPKKVRR